MPLLFLLFLLAMPSALWAEPLNCEQYPADERGSCENAKRFGLSLNAARLVEGLAERDFAASFCGAELAPAEKRQIESLLAPDPKWRALFSAHGQMLRERCIYDPASYCQSMGFGPR
ncbi:MAG: hypothetical protein K6G15_11520 [Desulfovibrio sp.]|nr:hypothetical protein [Desulfovibrio sp.]